MKKQLTLYVDTNRCMNCRACETACKLENSLPAGPRYTMVTETEMMDGEIPKCMFLPMPCLHCGDAFCVKACPTGAVRKRADGVVLVTKSRCIGCHECLWACPFGVPQFGEDGKMSKCTLCANAIDEGGKPACVKACPAEAIMFGSTEEISEIMRKRYAAASFHKRETVAAR
ncbi:MAG: 4Fe-4S dicluster domain-containing protein [Synergistaceae bacterium]|nr:4Fe-4S dicluster domain-containing protein [Synergistaceae bacterium]